VKSNKLTNKEKIINYLRRCSIPKTLKQISKGAKVNYNSLRRDIIELEDSGTVSWVWVDDNSFPIKYTL